MQNVMEFIKMIKMIQFDLQLIQTEVSKLWPEGQYGHNIWLYVVCDCFTHATEYEL